MIREFAPLVDCWYLTGATASGKTSLSLALATALGAEIVSMDSMAVYRGMDLGTAKPSLEEQQKVTHHLIDVVEPNQEYSLAEYLASVHEVVSEIHARKRTVLFVGGTPLYLISLLRGACDGPPADPEFRREVEEEVSQVGIEALHQRVAQVDPLSAAKLHPNDKRRLIRALEVYAMTGQPISHLQTQFEGKHTKRCRNAFVLSRSRSDLHERIERRTKLLFDSGFVDEVQALLGSYGNLSRTAMQGVGYQEVSDYLNGQSSLESAITETTIRTRRYVRRQETWFRRLSECHWVEAEETTSVDELVDRVLKFERTADAD